MVAALLFSMPCSQNYLEDSFWSFKTRNLETFLFRLFLRIKTNLKIHIINLQVSIYFNLLKSLAYRSIALLIIAIKTHMFQ